MMNDLSMQLSALLDNELPQDQAEALRQRMRHDPAIQAEYDRLAQANELAMAEFGAMLAQPMPLALARAIEQAPLANPAQQPANISRPPRPWLGWAAAIALAVLTASGGYLAGRQHADPQFASADDQANPEAGKAAAQQLVDAGVLVAVAHLNSGVSIPTAPIYAAAGIPQLAISTKPDYTRQGLPTTLRLVANDDLQSKAIGSYAAQLPGIAGWIGLDPVDRTGSGTRAASQVQSPAIVMLAEPSLCNLMTSGRAIAKALPRRWRTAVLPVSKTCTWKPSRCR